ncbi:Nuclear pore complex protein [Trichinella pseudospiralis]|uniref:Nuclear pore complex protein n=1 Tax=Trichinella pseudospiralis TaxID=6337 RepID=A0A0V1DX43_TRIPS|nr:Nuclear pore complex protein [Trichinella pseudospiralis]KRZ32141.1 Nuclear pore complex protein [Trichinella pseudospiralis]
MRLISLKLSVPVFVNKHSQLSCRFSLDGDWVWVIYMRQCFTWSAREENVAVCYTLSLPRCGLSYNADLVYMLPPAAVQGDLSSDAEKSPSCICISPEGAICYWELASQSSKFTEAFIDTKHDVCQALNWIPETRSCVVATASGSFYILKFPENILNKTAAPVLLTKSTNNVLSGVVRRVSSFFTFTNEYNETYKRSWATDSKGDGVCEFLGLTSHSLHSWTINGNDLHFSLKWMIKINGDNLIGPHSNLLMQGENLVSLNGQLANEAALIKIDVQDMAIYGKQLAILSHARLVESEIKKIVISIFSMNSEQSASLSRIIVHDSHFVNELPTRLLCSKYLCRGVMLSEHCVWNLENVDLWRSFNEAVIGGGELGDRLVLLVASTGFHMLEFGREQQNMRYNTTENMIRRLTIANERQLEKMARDSQLFPRFHASFLYFLGRRYEKCEDLMKKAIQNDSREKDLLDLQYSMCRLILDTDQFVVCLNDSFEPAFSLPSVLQAKGKALEHFADFLDWNIVHRTIPRRATAMCLVMSSLGLVESALVLNENNTNEASERMCTSAFHSIISESDEDSTMTDTFIKDQFFQRITNMRHFINALVTVEEHQLQHSLTLDVDEIELLCCNSRLLLTVSEAMLSKQHEALDAYPAPDLFLKNFYSKMVASNDKDIQTPLQYHFRLCQQFVQEQEDDPSDRLKNELVAIAELVLSDQQRTRRYLKKNGLLEQAAKIVWDTPESTAHEMLLALYCMGKTKEAIELAEKYRVFNMLAELCNRKGDMFLLHGLEKKYHKDGFGDAITKHCQQNQDFDILTEYALRNENFDIKPKREWLIGWYVHWRNKDYTECARWLINLAFREEDYQKRRQVPLNYNFVVTVVSLAKLVLHLNTDNSDTAELKKRIEALDYLEVCQKELFEQMKNNEMEINLEKALSAPEIVLKLANCCGNADPASFARVFIVISTMIKHDLLEETDHAIVMAWFSVVKLTTWPKDKTFSEDVLFKMRNSLISNVLQMLITREPMVDMNKLFKNVDALLSFPEFLNWACENEIWETTNQYLTSMRDEMSYRKVDEPEVIKKQ